LYKLIEIIIYSLFAGITIFLGGWLASLTENHFKKNIESYILHWSIAFGGGILYLIFQDIAPSSKMRNNWESALGANLEFLVGMIGTKILT